MTDHDPHAPISDDVSGELLEGGVKKDGSKRITANILGPVMAELDLISGLVGERETTVFVTSSKWARIAKEIDVMSKNMGGNPNPDNFRRIRLRSTTFVNALSDDEQAVNLLNVPEARACDFQNRRQRLISGRKS